MFRLQLNFSKNLAAILRNNTKANFIPDEHAPALTHLSHLVTHRPKVVLGITSESTFLTSCTKCWVCRSNGSGMSMLTDEQINGTDSITFTTDVGGNKYMYNEIFQGPLGVWTQHFAAHSTLTIIF